MACAPHAILDHRARRWGPRRCPKWRHMEDVEGELGLGHLIQDDLQVLALLGCRHQLVGRREVLYGGIVLPALPRADAELQIWTRLPIASHDKLPIAVRFSSTCSLEAGSSSPWSRRTFTFSTLPSAYSSCVVAAEVLKLVLGPVVDGKALGELGLQGSLEVSLGRAVGHRHG